MKKLLVVLLALTFVGILSAQATMSIETGGDAYILNGSTEAASHSYIDGNDVDDDDITLNFVDKDGAYGAKLYWEQYDALVPSSTTEYSQFGSWKVWYQYDFGKIEIGTAGDGANTDALTTDIEDDWDTDGYGTGIVYYSPAFSGLSFTAWLPAPVDGSTFKTEDALKTAGLSAKYVVENTLTLETTVLLGLVDTTNALLVDPSTKATKINAYANFTGIENLAIYGDVQYDQTKIDSLAEVGAKYTMGPAAFTGEFSSNWGKPELATGDGELLYNVAGRVDYTLNEKIAFQAQLLYFNYTSTGLTTLTADDTRYDAYGKVIYTLGGGLSSWIKLGNKTDVNLYYQLGLSYGVNL
jgi:hypothetical protein